MLSWREKVSSRLKSWNTKPRFSRRKAARRPSGDGGEILAVQKDLAGGGPVQGRQNVEKRRLSGAGFSHNGHKLPDSRSKETSERGLHLIAAEAGV